MPYDSYGKTLEEIMAREAETRQGMTPEEMAAREAAIMNQLQRGNTDLAWDMSGGPYRGNVGSTLSSQESWSRTPMGPNGQPMGPMTQEQAWPSLTGGQSAGPNGQPMGPMTQAQAQAGGGWPSLTGGTAATQPSSSGPIVGPPTRPPSLAGPSPSMGPSMGPGAPGGAMSNRDYPYSPSYGGPPMGGSQQTQQSQQSQPQERGWWDALVDPRMKDGSVPQGNQMFLDAMGAVGNAIVNPTMKDGSMPQGNQMLLDALGMGAAPQRGSGNPGMGWLSGQPSAMNESSYPYSPNYNKDNMRPSSLQYGLGQQGAPPAQTDTWNRILDLFGNVLKAYQNSEY